ncbi:5-(carboxyamino)imidazole ribonucleotide synthase [Pontibacterium sp.]|uniref:5-(carboxyamino)imidazole ribonucleotide synthase n=1 Tax=Pontibacterium sp. TaxID=2036026 RepID=UPI003512B6B9
MNVAVVGCGQLARMLALAGWPMGYRFSFLAMPGENRGCVEGLGTIVEFQPEQSMEELYEAMGKPDVVTVEREHLDVELLKAFQPFCAVCPSPDAVKICQHRGREKRFLNGIGIPTAPFKLAANDDELRQGIAEMGFPVLVKTCEEGYDGYGQWMLRTEEDFAELMALDSRPELVIEGLVKFEREVSLVAARNTEGEVAFYPLTENYHSNGILLTSIVPAELPSPELVEQAEEIGRKVLDAMDYVGVLAIELFVTDEGLVVNELAPRVHNSGHWTQALNVSSQFENHLRAITSLGLGNTQPSQCVGMVNLLGCRPTKAQQSLSNVQVHQYNKSLRPGRKVGHLNLWNDDRAQLLDQLNSIKQDLYGPDSV